MKNLNLSDYYYCITAGQTDVGKRRKANEDRGSHFITQNGLVSVVCDGMGGHVGGAIASEVAVQTIHEFLDSQYFDDPREAIGFAIDAANKVIIQKAKFEPQLSGMGSTCVLLIVRDAKVYIGHVGDSRIYLIREKRITQLTKDHSFVQILVDMGEITKQQAEHHPRKNEITNALGLSNMSPATVKAEAIMPQAGDCFLLCSDGLSGMVDDHHIEKIVSKQRELRTQERADLLVQTANYNGGVDNITVELVEFTITPNATKPNNKKKLILGVVSLFVLLCAVVCGILWMHKSQPKIDYEQWGLVPFKEERPVFIIEVNQAEKQTTVRFGDEQTKVIDHILESESQIETNLTISKSETGYSLLFGEAFPVNTDSVFVRLSFDKSQHLYSVQLKAEPTETPLEPHEFNPIPYKKGEKIATLSFMSNINLSILSVKNNDENEIEGRLIVESVKVENTQIDISRTNQGQTVWIISSREKKDVIISFICEKGEIGKEYRIKYTYIIPFETTTPIVKSGNKPRDKSGDKTGDKSGDKTGDKSGDKTGDKSGDKTGDKSGDKTGDKSGDKTEDKSGDKTEDKSGDKTGDKSGDKTGDKSGDKTGDKSGDKTGDKSGDKTRDKSGDKPRDKSGDKTGDKSGNKTRDKSGDKTGDKSGNKTGDKSGDKTGDKSGDKPRDKSGDKPRDKSGDKTRDKSGDKTGDKSGDKPRDKSGDKTGDKSGDKTGDKSGDKPRDKSGDKPRDKSGSQEDPVDLGSQDFENIGNLEGEKQ